MRILKTNLQIRSLLPNNLTRNRRILTITNLSNKLTSNWILLCYPMPIPKQTFSRLKLLSVFITNIHSIFRYINTIYISLKVQSKSLFLTYRKIIRSLMLSNFFPIKRFYRSRFRRKLFHQKFPNWDISNKAKSLRITALGIWQPNTLSQVPNFRLFHRS